MDVTKRKQHFDVRCETKNRFQSSLFCTCSVPSCSIDCGAFAAACKTSDLSRANGRLRQLPVLCLSSRSSAFLSSRTPSVRPRDCRASTRPSTAPPPSCKHTQTFNLTCSRHKADLCSLTWKTHFTESLPGAPVRYMSHTAAVPTHTTRRSPFSLFQFLFYRKSPKSPPGALRGTLETRQ